MKVLVFTEGTIIMHKGGVGYRREEIVKQVESNEKSVLDFAAYVPIENAVQKLNKWKNQGAEILYLTSRKNNDEVVAIQNVLKKYFPEGKLLFRKGKEQYRDIVERIKPDILIEDDCESIGGESEMTITYLKSEIKSKIKSIPVKEFGGIDHLSDDVNEF
jgi:hypothetical protein